MIWWILAALVFLLFVGTDMGSVTDTITTVRESSLWAKVHQMSLGIAQAEGFNENGTLPRRYNNPGDLVDPATGIKRKFTTEQDGWDALDYQVWLMLTGRSSHYKLQDTLYQVAGIFTGGDNPVGWANVVSQYMGISISQTLQEYVDA